MSGDEAGFQRDLAALRAFARGDLVIGTATFRCPTTTCPVALVRIGISEQRGLTKAMGWPCQCNRCGAELSYIGLERSA